MPWSDRETQALLGVWGEDHVQLSLRGCLKNRHVFEYISRRMMNQGECKFYDQMEEILSKELNFDSLAEDSLDMRKLLSASLHLRLCRIE
ncbi:hypothetical protein J4Q44_G00142660 [Coregonus suidteri]|uniref:Myb/SANT-like DNA-binding domain-containing protein n=1 Tax=Coregonus suidteri TaxID=861788 RepID=A0AAN8R5Z3_9TELE